MNRVDLAFAALRSSGGRALMPFLTAGDPSPAPADIAALLAAAADAGAAVCEVGIPFSDPIADGPVIQESMTNALRRGVRVAHVFEAIRLLRKDRGIEKLGLMAMVSYSIVHRLGADRFVSGAQEAGFDGFIFPDVPLEESEPVRRRVAEAGMALSMLIAPTTPLERARRIAAASSGFVYLMSRAGITGERSELPPELPGRIAALREVTDLPIAVGFGISTPQQVRQVVQVADAAIVGSALVRRIARRRDEPIHAIGEHVAAFVRELAQGLSPSVIAPQGA